MLPLSGSIWMVELRSLELQHLGIDRFKSSERSWNRDEEDDFCEKIRTLGESWRSRSSDTLWIGGRCRKLHEMEPVFSICRHAGFLEGGGVYVGSRYPRRTRKVFKQGDSSAECTDNGGAMHYPRNSRSCLLQRHQTLSSPDRHNQRAIPTGKTD
ncbi:hypothetical protein BDV23DRAFT_130311 [Aspergillus alliaceus]|uniref:Uncharacterized protein n=1 Tax=Petromyces alliaceus TaxID=209559 RepID=A0A5N7BZC5_PETAA|nr:hypothetical protein BDV23DRAFT_130311 [Aspergillus alliaceus]